MIDREARNKSAEILRRFINGQITNYDFEDKEPVSKDPAIHAIWVSLWPYYCDLREHKMSGNWELPSEIKSSMARWVLFLHTNEEYQWPTIAFPGVRPLRHGFLSKLFGVPAREKNWMSKGNYQVWPFINSESFEYAKQNPKLLSST